MSYLHAPFDAILVSLQVKIYLIGYTMHKNIYCALICGAGKKTITIGDTLVLGKEQICFLCHINILEGQLSAHFF